MRYQEFDKSVKRSLYELAYQLEKAEAERFVEEDLREMERYCNMGYGPSDGFYSQTQTFTFDNGIFSYNPRTYIEVVS